jgi:hypothetical protein
MGKSSGYCAPTGVKRTRFLGDKIVLGLNSVQTNLVRVLMNDQLDLGARNEAPKTLREHHMHNEAVVTILEEHFAPMGDGLREKAVVFPNSPR